VNSEAIYGARPTPFGAEFGEAVTARDEYGREMAVSSARAWRCTTKPGRLYFHLFEWPRDGFEVRGISGKAAQAFLLADPARTPLAVTRSDDRVRVQLPPRPPQGGAAVLCIEMAG
jgi:alpha-L-fucosidase